VGIAEKLLRSGVVVDATDAHGNTPLFAATFDSKGRGDMIKLLLKAGADKNHRNKHGVSPASLASTIANYDVARFLLLTILLMLESGVFPFRCVIGA
jgi:ankyrin repeat protein